MLQGGDELPFFNYISFIDQTLVNLPGDFEGDINRGSLYIS